MGKMNIKIERALREIEKLPFQQILPQVNLIKEQLAKNCDVDGQNANGDTLLHIAVKSGQLRGFNTIEAGDNQNPRPENVFDLAYLVKNFNPNPLIENNQGMTPSMLAAHLKLTSEWQFLSSYEQKYMARETSKALNALYILAESSRAGEKPRIRPIKKSHTDISRCIMRFRGNKRSENGR